MTDRAKLEALCEIMEKVQALADLLRNVDAYDSEAERRVIDVQEQAAKALGLPEGLALMTGDEAVDLDD